MRVLGFNRVELIVREDQIDAAVDQFNSVLGLSLPHPHAIEGQPVLSATDFDGGIELVAPVGGEGGFGARLAKHGPGQIGPLVFEIDDIDAARSWLGSRGLRIRYEYDSSAGNAEEAASGVYQLVLDPDQWFGFSVTLMRRTGQARLSVFSARARGGDSIRLHVAGRGPYQVQGGGDLGGLVRR
jgi:hypothetical protein